MPNISVCIPAYNQVGYLKRAIDSVLSQTYKDYEIVITDDTSGNIIRDLVYSYEIPQIIKYHQNSIPLGSPANWNEALKHATGEYIKILHHDDWLYDTESLENFIKLMRDNPDTDFGFSATQAINPKGKDWFHVLSVDQLESLKKNALVLFSNNLIGAPSNIIIRRRGAIKFDVNLKWLVDVEYYIRLLQQKMNVAYTAKPLVVTYLGDGRVTDECVDNKQVEIFEYFYVLSKINQHKTIYSKHALNACIRKVLLVCKKYKIRNATEIRSCGFQDIIPSRIKAYLFINNISPLLGKLLFKFLRFL